MRANNQTLKHNLMKKNFKTTRTTTLRPILTTKHLSNHLKSKHIYICICMHMHTHICTFKRAIESTKEVL